LHRARLSVRKEMAQLLDALNTRANEDPGPAKPSRKSRKAAQAGSTKRPAACRDLFANLSEYMDGHVEAPACDQMAEHIEACPACVAFLRELRAAIDRCRSLDIPCDSAVAPRLRSILTQEYLRMLGMGTTKNLSHPVTKSSPYGSLKLKKEG
jgi:RNA polymerase sigma-70 factor (ECF subfamily)